MSSVFTVTRDQVIQLALRKLGVLELGQQPDPATVANASLALNLFIKQMATKGLKLWKVNQVIVPLVAGQTSYVLGPASTGTVDVNTDKPLKLIQAFLRNTSVTPYIDTPLQILSQQEYNTLGSKFSQGTSNSVYYEVRNTTGNIYTYLTADSNTSTNYDLYLTVQQPMADLNTGKDIPDFPTEWMNTLVWNLADQLSIEYSVPATKTAEIGARAKAYREDLEDWDVEATSTFFQADLRMANVMYGRGT